MRTIKTIRQIKGRIVFIPRIIYNFLQTKFDPMSCLSSTNLGQRFKQCTQTFTLLDILKFCFQHSSTKSPCKRLSTQNWFRGHTHARLLFLKAICSKIFHSRLNLFWCCNISSLWNLDVPVRAIKKQKAIATKATTLLLEARHGFRISRQFDFTTGARVDRSTRIIWASENNASKYQG